MEVAEAVSAITEMTMNLGPVETALGYTKNDVTVFVFDTISNVRKTLKDCVLRRIYVKEKFAINDKEYQPGEKINVRISEIFYIAVKYAHKHLFEIYVDFPDLSVEKMCNKFVAPTSTKTMVIENGEIPPGICIHDADGAITYNMVVSLRIPEKMASLYVMDGMRNRISPGAGMFTSTITYSDAPTAVPGLYYHPYRLEPETHRLATGKNMITIFNCIPIRYIELQFPNNQNCAHVISEITLKNTDKPAFFKMSAESMSFFPGCSENRIIIPLSGDYENYPEFMYSDLRNFKNFDMHINIEQAGVACQMNVVLHLANIFGIISHGLCGLKFAD